MRIFIVTCTFLTYTHFITSLIFKQSRFSWHLDNSQLILSHNSSKKNLPHWPPLAHCVRIMLEAENSSHSTDSNASFRVWLEREARRTLTNGRKTWIKSKKLETLNKFEKLHFKKKLCEKSRENLKQIEKNSINWEKIDNNRKKLDISWSKKFKKNVNFGFLKKEYFKRMFKLRPKAKLLSSRLFGFDQSWKLVPCSIPSLRVCYGAELEFQHTQ